MTSSAAQMYTAAVTDVDRKFPGVTRRNAGAKTIDKLAALTGQLKEAEHAEKVAKALVDTLKTQIKELTADFALPEQEGSSEYLNVPAADATLRVTRITYTPTVDPGRLLAEVGRDTFLDVVVVKKVELDLDGWRAALAAERVTNEQLERSLEQREPTVTVALGKLRR